MSNSTNRTLRRQATPEPATIQIVRDAKRSVATALSMLIICLIGTNARGGFLISYSNLDITAGSIGSVNVEITSDAPLITPDNLDLFTLHLVLEPLAATGSIGFADLQTEDHLAPGSLNDSYIFKGDSIGESLHSQNESISTVSTTDLANDTLDLLDATESFAGAYVSVGNGSLLLFQVRVDATSANAGDTFSIRLINDSRTSLSDKDGNVYSTNNPGPGLVLSGASFSSSTLRVVATPEPSSTLLLLLCGPAYYACARRRRKGKQALKVA